MIPSARSSRTSRSQPNSAVRRHSVAARYKYVPGVDKHVPTVRCAPISLGFTQKFATAAAVGERCRENGHTSPCVAAYNLASACRPRGFSARVEPKRRFGAVPPFRSTLLGERLDPRRQPSCCAPNPARGPRPPPSYSSPLSVLGFWGMGPPNLPVCFASRGLGPQPCGKQAGGG